MGSENDAKNETLQRFFVKSEVAKDGKDACRQYLSHRVMILFWD